MAGGHKAKGKKKKSTGKRVGRVRQIMIALPQARLISENQFVLAKDQVRHFEDAQKVMNGLYKRGSKYGDCSSAFMVLMEQAKAGVGNSPKPVVGDTVHDKKCRDHSEPNQGLHNYLGIGLPKKAEDRLKTEIAKMQEALAWADDYRAGKNPKIPAWARPWKADIEMCMEE